MALNSGILLSWLPFLKITENKDILVSIVVSGLLIQSEKKIYDVYSTKLSHYFYFEFMDLEEASP